MPWAVVSRLSDAARAQCAAALSPSRRATRAPGVTPPQALWPRVPPSVRVGVYIICMYS